MGENYEKYERGLQYSWAIQQTTILCWFLQIKPSHLTVSKAFQAIRLVQLPSSLFASHTSFIPHVVCLFASYTSLISHVVCLYASHTSLIPHVICLFPSHTLLIFHVVCLFPSHTLLISHVVCLFLSHTLLIVHMVLQAKSNNSLKVRYTHLLHKQNSCIDDGGSN